MFSRTLQLKHFFTSYWKYSEKCDVLIHRSRLKLSDCTRVIFSLFLCESVHISINTGFYFPSLWRRNFATVLLTSYHRPCLPVWNKHHVLQGSGICSVCCSRTAMLPNIKALTAQLACQHLNRFSRKGNNAYNISSVFKMFLPSLS